MLLDFDIDKMERKLLQSSPEKEGHGWSYLSVYSLRDFKDVYQILLANPGVRSVKSLLKFCLLNNYVSETGKEWTQRNLLELVNALKKTGLVDFDSTSPLLGDVFNTKVNEDLSELDKDSLRKIFNSYFRFEDFSRLLEGEDNGKAVFLYAYMENERFFNRFVRPDRSVVYCIDDNRKDMMRFWDVYTKWGMTLECVNKISMQACNLDSFNLELKNGYVLNKAKPMPEDFDIMELIDGQSDSDCIYIPDLEWSIISQFGYHIDKIKKRLLEVCAANSSRIRLQRITEIFIDHGERGLYPFQDGTYMSHILKL